LIIQIKRFNIKKNYDYGPNFTEEKNDTFVSYPINDFDLGEYIVGPEKNNINTKYDLYGIIQHFGSLKEGKYSAICKKDNNWTTYNDSILSHCENPITKNAYILFYKRKDFEEKNDNFNFNRYNENENNEISSNNNDTIQNEASKNINCSKINIINNLDQKFNYEKIINNLKNDINIKDKKIKELENEIKLKDEELNFIKTLNNKLTKEKEQMNNNLIDLELKNVELNKIINENNNKLRYNENDFIDLKEISNGEFATVYSAYSIKDKINICLKKIDH